MSTPILPPRFSSLRTRFLGATLLVIAVVMITLVAIVEHRQRAAIVGEVTRRGVVLARNLAALSSGPLLLYNYTALEQNVARVAEDPDVAFAIILDAAGAVTAHSQDPSRVGAPLSGGPPPARLADADATWREVRADGETVLEFAVPIRVADRVWGTVRVGLSRERMEREITATRRDLALLAVLVLLAGGLAAAVVARRIAGPVRALAGQAVAISRGDLVTPIEPRSRDEIGQLAGAFNHMAGELARQRADLERTHAELARRFAELSDLKSYTDDILRSLASGVVTVDLEGRVVMVNAAAEAMTGRTLGETRGQLVAEAFGGAPELAQLLTETLAGAGAVVVCVIAGPTGRAWPVELTSAPLRGGDGQELGAVALLRDLTAERQLTDQVRRADRLAAIGTLAAGLAHEIKNPLTSLLTFTRHLSRRVGDERFRQRFQSVVPRGLERINQIVEGLLRLARPTRLDLAPVRLPELIDQSLELYGEGIEAQRIAVVREYAPGVPSIHADAAHLYQVLVNLVANAVEAMPDGGVLAVRCRWATLPDGSQSRIAWAWERRVEIEVEDTGHGIPASEQANVFSPFYTTKPAGTGLGLALAHKIVEDHGGTLTFRSVPGQGTAFVVLLPFRVAQPAPSIARDPGPAGEHVSRTLG